MRIRALLLCIATASLLVGCQKQQVTPRAESPASVPYIKAVYSAPLTLDPAQITDSASLAVVNLLYDGLLEFDSNLTIRGALAESWTTSPDGKTLSFKLRPGIRFHDGTAVRPQDVISSFERLVRRDSKVFSYYDCIEGAAEVFHGKRKSLTGIRATGADRVEIRLRSPFPPFLSVLAGATAKVLPSALVGRPGFFRAPVGSGAFRWVRRIEEPGRPIDLVLERFDGYAGPQPKLARIIFRAMAEGQALQEAGRGGVHDLVNFPLTGDEPAFAHGQHIKTSVAATWIIGLNSRVPPFDRLAVRRAFRDSLDTEAFRSKFFPDAIAAQGYIPPGLPGFQWKYESASGMKSATTRYPSAVSTRKIEMMIPQELARHQEMKAFLESQFRSKGWNVEVTPVPWDRLMAGYNSKKLQAFLVSMNMDYPDTEFLIRNFESDNPDSFSGLRDSKLDTLIRNARATPDRIARHALYVQSVGILNDLAPTINLFHPRGHYWVHPCVRGLEPNILADSYIDYRKIWVDSGCQQSTTRGNGA